MSVMTELTNRAYPRLTWQTTEKQVLKEMTSSVKKKALPF